MSLRPAMFPGLCLLLLSAPAWSADKVLDRTFDVTPGGRLTVMADSGDITVRGSDSNRMVVHITAKGSESSMKRMAFSAEQTAEGVTVRAEDAPDGWLDWLSFNWRMQVRVTVDLPRRYDLDLKTSGGDIDVAHVEGDANGKTSGGSIKLADLRGPVRMKTSGGDVEAEQIDGNTQLQTSGGNVVVSSVRGTLDLRTSGGGIRLRSIEGATVAHTSSGNVVAESIRGDVDLETSGGDVKGHGLDGRIRAHTSGGNVTVALTGENRGIDATSSGGDITIMLPASARATVDASTSGGSIVSDLPVTAGEFGERRLKGTINGGGAARARAHVRRQRPPPRAIRAIPAT